MEAWEVKVGIASIGYAFLPTVSLLVPKLLLRNLPRHYPWVSSLDLTFIQLVDHPSCRTPSIRFTPSSHLNI